MKIKGSEPQFFTARLKTKNASTQSVPVTVVSANSPGKITMRMQIPDSLLHTYLKR